MVRRERNAIDFSFVRIDELRLSFCGVPCIPKIYLQVMYKYVQLDSGQLPLLELARVPQIDLGASDKHPLVE